MKEQAAQLKKKLEDRNSLASGIQRKVNLLLNKITPDNSKSIRKQIGDLIEKEDYNEEVIKTIGITVFNKA